MTSDSVGHKLQQAIALLQSCLEEIGSVDAGRSALAAAGTPAVASHIDAKRVGIALDIEPEQVPELFEVRGGKLFMHVKPVGKSVADRQRCLVNTLLVGYKFGLGISNVRLSVLAEAADEWGIKGGHFSRDIAGENTRVQMKAGGKGSDPLVSLSPGSIEYLKDGIKALLGAS